MGSGGGLRVGYPSSGAATGRDDAEGRPVLPGETQRFCFAEDRQRAWGEEGLGRGGAAFLSPLPAYASPPGSSTTLRR